tara:strand:- start:35879 stop:36718 length:840 start_codon:yes stop_codon:yes gene_type:complete
MLNRLILFALTLTLAACADISPQARRAHVDELAVTQQWHKVLLPTDHFVLAAYLPPVTPHDDILSIYIEGDGFSWATSSRPSTDPIPRNPVGLRLAMRTPPGSAVYLARPCQYVDGANARGCDVAYWTNKRFAPEVIDASNQAIDALKARFGAHRLILVGYSGGGAIAALVAARRTDIAQLVTVAGNLDPDAWTRLHHVSPLTGSLNPADGWRELLDVPQLHLVGARDRNVSAAVTHAYANRFPASHRPTIRMVPDADHSCCWVNQWPNILDSDTVVHR